MSASAALLYAPRRPRLVSVPTTGAEMATTNLQTTATPGVYRRGKRYVYAYRVRGIQRWGTAETLDEARRRKRQAQTDADRGELENLSGVAFGAYARDWIGGYQGRTSNGFRESTRQRYRRALEIRVIPYFDGVARLRLAEITPRDVKAFIRWLIEQEHPRKRGQLLRKSTVREHVAVLRALMGDAMEEGVIRSNPAAGVRVSVPEGDGTRRPRSEDRRAMTIDELRVVLAELPPRWRLLFEFLAHTGLRIGELSELRWGPGSRPQGPPLRQAAMAVRRRARLRAQDALWPAGHSAVARSGREAPRGPTAGLRR